MKFIKLNLSKRTLYLISILLFLAIVVYFFKGTAEDTIVFNTQVKPILNKHCIHCHGGVKQSGGFSLMTRELALLPTESGQPAIVPGQPGKSAFINRLLIDDPEERMPYEAAPLSKEEINVLKAWVRQGAQWGKHWAYQPVEKVAVPVAPKVALSSLDDKNRDPWPTNAIDHFVLEKMQTKDLQPSPVASKNALLRRLSLDLTGVPAPEHLADQFLNHETPLSYGDLVDSLLNLPTFGERWASMWLDLARYADSKGFERDVNRDIWEYRDYVIRAFNQDLPYDQFITEQIAGDLLEDPTDDQYIATGFHRNTTTNDEGGTDNEEYRVAAVVDRVNTTWESLLGTTFSCVQCHGHPYDPFFHEDYYKFMAFFNNTRDNDTHKDYPLLRKLSKEEQQKLEGLKNWVAEVESPERAESIKTFIKTWQPSIYSIETDSFVNAELYDTKYLGFRKDGQARLAQVSLEDKNLLLIKAWTNEGGGSLTIFLDKPGGEVLAKKRLPNTNRRSTFIEIPFPARVGIFDLYFQYENPGMKNPDGVGCQVDWLHFTTTFPGENHPGYLEKKADYWALMEAEVPTTLIMMENSEDWRRKTHVFDRGNWLVLKEEVKPNVPEVLPGFAESWPKNRMGLANWLTNKDNPLTGRTIVNRFWEQLFGYGLVETLEDLGTQGTNPTHPELLDWLAYHFMNELEWSTKDLLRLMVNSSTYRQSADVSQEMLELDPYNAYYARGPRIRLSAEQIRDQALAISGLLNDKMYGPPVMPYQPGGLWQTPYNSDRWQTDTSSNAYRRAIYTYMKRSLPYPSFETFDVAPRQVCVARRIRTNTPLQALVTLNDPVYVEAAQHFAKRVLDMEPNTPEATITLAYERAVGKSIEAPILKILTELFTGAVDHFRDDEEAMKKMAGQPFSKNVSAESAAMVVVTNSIMNLDEFLTK